MDALARGGSERTATALQAPVMNEGLEVEVGAGDIAYPVDTSPALARLLRTYEQDRQVIPVTFRDLVPWIKVGERATHYLHSYPAKLLPQIAHFFLASHRLATRSDCVLDPFAGAGTVPLEAVLSGRRALHADINPLARLITRVKLTPIPEEALVAAMARVDAAYSVAIAGARPDVVNIDHWYSVETIAELSRLKIAVEAEADPTVRAFLQVTFSAVARKVSKADPRFSVPVRRKPGATQSTRTVWESFAIQLEANRDRFATLAGLLGGSTAVATSAGEDARELKAPNGSPLADGSVGFILTSPPYAGAQKYVRAASLNLGWLGLAGSRGLTAIERLTIGREHLAKAIVEDCPDPALPEAMPLLARIRAQNPLRAAICASYLYDMRAALAESVRVLRPGGHFVLVIGDNTVCGEAFPSSTFLRLMLERMGLETRLEVIDDIRSRGLITRRAATAGVIASERVIVLAKPAG